MRPLDLIVFLLYFVSTVTSQESPNNEPIQKYDPNSLEMNKKLMKVFLKLFYQTANRVMALKNRPENRVDADVQNISISDILKPHNSEIQGRFFFPAEPRGFFDNLNPANAISIMSKSATGGLLDTKELAPNLGQTLIDISNKALDGMNSSIRIVPEGNSGLGGQEGPRIEEPGKESNISAPSLRFMSDLATPDNSTSTNSTSTNSTSTNSTDKVEGRINLILDPVSSTVEPANATKAPEIIKREASVLSLNNPSNNLNGNFPSSNITDPAPDNKGVAAESLRMIQSREIRSPSSKEKTDDIFDFPEEKDIKDVEPIIGNMKLGEIVNQFSYI